MEEEGNGKKVAPGAVFDLENLQRPDGIITSWALSQNRENSGVLHTAMTAIKKNEDYRQELKTAYFNSPQKQMQMVLALDELKECGIDETLVIDLLLAMKAGIKGGFIHDVFEALTHTTFSTNYGGKKSGSRWWNKGESRDGTGSPIA